MEKCKPSLSEGTTEQPVPESKWYYNCNFNRFGLLVLASFKMVLSMVLIVILHFSIILCFMFGDPLPLYHIVLLSLAFLLDAIDTLIGFSAVISIYQKDLKIMEMYYMNSIYIFGSIEVLCCLAYYNFSQKHDVLLILFSVSFLSLNMPKPHDEDRSSEDEE